CGKDIKKNILYAAAGENNPALYKKEIKLLGVSFINPNHFSNSREWFLPVSARVRYRQPLQKASLFEIKNKKSNLKNFKVVFEKPQRAIAPGQSAVFYLKSGETLGGGIIS
ncbi:MAG: aminomethyltransferase beta-barrel domain-containing protein, partial [Patescibacteria group bacterium]